MDLGRWFRNIEYLYGILNSINERKKIRCLSKSLYNSMICFKSMAEQYILHTNSSDTNIMLNRINVLLLNLEQKNVIVESDFAVQSFTDNSTLETNPDTLPNITFFELEKWKQNIMYKVGILMSMADNEHKMMFKKQIINSIKVISIYTISYLRFLSKSDVQYIQKIHDLKTLLIQVKNLYESLMRN
jgi:hypothetical protein